MKLSNLEPCMYAFRVYMQMVLLYFWIHMFFGNQAEVSADETVGKTSSKIKILNRKIADKSKSQVFGYLLYFKSFFYFEWFFYFCYLLSSYYWIDTLEKYIGFHIVILSLLSFFYHEEKSLCIEKILLILLCFCMPEFLISCARIETEYVVFRYGIYTNIWQVFSATICQIILFLLLGARIGFYYKNNEKEEIEKILLIVVFLTVPFLSLSILNLLNGRIGKQILYPIIICFLLINLLIVCVIKMSFSLKVGKEKQKVVEKQNLFYQNQLEVVRNSSEYIDVLRHDLNHHLLTLQTLIKNKNWEGTLRYIERMTGQIEVMECSENTGNLVIDSILNYKKGIALQKGILFETRLEIPNTLALSDFDIAVLLGNLLDNALHAAEETKQGFLFCTIKYSKNRLFIFIRNSVCGKEKKILGELQYGIGLQSVKQVVSKYQGSMECSCRNGEFYSKVLLFLDGVDYEHT